MPLISWIAIAVASGLLAGFSLPWPVLLVAIGAAVWAAAADFVAPAVLLYFLAACALAVASPRPRQRFSATATADRWSFAGRSRDRASKSLERAFGDDAPMAKALLIADQSEIPREIKNRYADAGIVHMLSISGLHVTIIAGSVVLLLQLMRMPLRTASFVSATIVVGYVYLLGFPAAAVRSATMICIVVLSRAFQRYTTAWSALALGALVPLLRPETVLDLGYQLSVAGMAALISAGQLARRSRISRLKGWRRGLVRSLLVSAIATAATAPLIAASFGRLSIIAPMTNLVADPVIALAQPILFLALVLAPLPAASGYVAAAAHPLLVAFEFIATIAAGLPFAAIPVVVSPAVALLASVSSAALVVACASKFPGRACAVAAGAFCAAVLMP